MEKDALLDVQVDLAMKTHERQRFQEMLDAWRPGSVAVEFPKYGLEEFIPFIKHVRLSEFQELPHEVLLDALVDLSMKSVQRQRFFDMLGACEVVVCDDRSGPASSGKHLFLCPWARRMQMRYLRHLRSLQTSWWKIATSYGWRSYGILNAIRQIFVLVFFVANFCSS